MSTITTVNPYTQETITTYNADSDAEVTKKLAAAEARFQSWRTTEISERCKKLDRLAEQLEDKRLDFANLMADEIGKPITQGLAEIDKCIWLCDFYAQNADDFLADQLIDTDADESFISYDPLGVILAIMPWNYPFWQVLRFAIPTLTAGNTGILKHASNVTGCGLAIQQLFEDAGYPKGCFQTVLASHEQIEDIVAHPAIKAVTLTGSEGAGRSIAALAGKHLKKTVLELGGNNACIVLKDADLKKHIKTMVKARMQNAGQSCIAAKRFIVVEAIYDSFLEAFVKDVKQLKIGDPRASETDMATLAREDLAKEVEKQVEDSIKKGAKVVCGHQRKGAVYHPTVVTDVVEGMPLFNQEVFGPIAAIIKVKNKAEAYKLANESKFGLGTMIFTKDVEAAKKQTSAIEDGAYFINDMVKSDPRLPFGGTKASGYGRELSKEGMLEFVNVKTVYIKK